MASVPLSGTNITLMSGVPFSNDYKHTRWFDSLSDQRVYFNSRSVVHSITQATPTYVQNVGGRSFIAVDQSIDQLYGSNYVMFQNADYNGKWFYAFVTKLEYKQRNSTFVYLEIDTLQTWMFDLTFKPSFVVREHCPLWNSDGSPVINTVDEGLNYGTEYRIATVEEYRPYDDVYFLVVISKKAMHGDGGYIGSLNGLPQNLCTYVHPFKMDGSVPSSNITLTPLVGAVVNAMYLSTDAVNNIVSMYITDVLPDFPTYASGTITFDTAKYEAAAIGTINTIFVNSMQNYEEFIYSAGEKYAGYTTNEESKLLMYPYTLLELTDFKGNKATYKNEYIDNQVISLSVRGSLGVNNKLVYELKDYLTGNLSDDNVKTSVAIETGLIHDNPNDLPVMTDSLAAFIQGNRNSVQNQRNSIYFNGVMNAVGAGVGMVASAATENPIGVVSSLEGGIKGAGNSVLQMQGIEAKIKDISNTPPSIVKMGANTNFDYGNGYNGLWIIKKEITQEYRTKLKDFFNMFGYKLNEVKIPNFHTRTNWNYVQTTACNITGNFNNEDLQELKTIFDHGITLWHTDDIGNYDLANEVI